MYDCQNSKYIPNYAEETAKHILQPNKIQKQLKTS